MQHYLHCSPKGEKKYLDVNLIKQNSASKFQQISQGSCENQMSNICINSWQMYNITQTVRHTTSVPSLCKEYWSLSACCR